MSENEKTNGQLDPIMKPFADFWAGYFQQANDATRELMTGFSSAADAKSWQRRWSDAVSKSMDAYMRSPMFLAAMKQNTDALIKAKQHTDDLAQEIARNANIPTASDISGLFERLHSVEETILRRLGAIEKRLGAIEEHVGSREPMSAT